MRDTRAKVVACDYNRGHSGVAMPELQTPGLEGLWVVCWRSIIIVALPRPLLLIVFTVLSDSSNPI